MTAATEKRRGWFRPLYLLSVAVVLVLIAHAHLVYVAVATQPDCVPHLKERGGSPGAYRAAKSAC